MLNKRQKINFIIIIFIMIISALLSQLLPLSIAHRLTTLENCDSILVFNNGQIVQKGKYHELIKTSGIFQDMYNGKLK